ncbi:hypothetical protein [Brevibacillus choshinensis]|uniref:hypothetical protein n=1 Tax=Brevibacillus choshinensis TaxID=54911 RepID=UPI002E1E5731|nr:hypothetical protein [Brevibacillus choshinensis]
MKIIVCYPMKSLAKTYMPDASEALVAETSSEFFRYVQHYQPEAAVLFSEMFSNPAWEWLPAVKDSLPEGIPLIIVPLYRDETIIGKVTEETQLQGVYVLSAQLSQEEIRDQISLILGLINDTQVKVESESLGIVYALMSYGSSGITTFCINYPIVLAKQNPDKRIAVLDMNEAKPDLTRFFKLQKHQLALFRPDFLDAGTAKKRNWINVCKQSIHMPNLYYAHAATKWKSSEITNLITAFRHQFDFVYVDWGYCFPETETLQRMLYTADRNLLFVRADPFSIENAREWIRTWRKRGVACEVLLSHLDKGQPFRIGEDISLYGIVPRISEGRLMQSHRSNSVLVEEFFPPKPYMSSLKQMAEAEYSEKSAVLS